MALPNSIMCLHHPNHHWWTSEPPIYEVFSALRFSQLLRTFTNKMVNSHNFAIILQDYSVSCDLCVSQHRHWLSLSCFHQAESYTWRHLHVCSSSYAGKRALIPSCNNLSWETVFTAGFELDVLQRKRPYRWTIWVSVLLHMWPCHHVDESSYTSEPATPAYFVSSASSFKWTAQEFRVR